MTQSTILAPGTSTATSTDIVVGSGSIVTVGMFVTSGVTLQSDYITVTYKTPGVDAIVGYITTASPNLQLNGPGTFRAIRQGSVTSLGISLEI